MPFAILKQIPVGSESPVEAISKNSSLKITPTKCYRLLFYIASSKPGNGKKGKIGGRFVQISSLIKIPNMD